MIALLAIVRGIHLASLMAIFGGSAYALLLQRGGLPEPPVRSERSLLAIAATLALASAIVWFALIAGQMSGDWRGSIDPATLELTASATRFGHIFIGRFIGLLALWFLCVSKNLHRVAVSVLAALLLASLAPISHAGAIGGEPALMGSASDAAHVLSAGFWLGGLIILATMIPQHWGDPHALLGPLRVFSKWGTWVVALLVVSGAINAVSILPISMLSLHHPYVELLLVKVGLAVAMIVLAALNRWRFAPALRTGGSEAVGNLMGSVGVEIALGVTIVSIVAYLGLIAPH